MWRPLTALAVLLAVVLAGPDASGGESLETAIAGVLEAHGAGDPAGLRAAVQSVAADPWVVVEFLATTGRGDVAESVAGASPYGTSGDALARYAAWRRTHPLETAARRRWVEAVEGDGAEPVPGRFAADAEPPDGVARADWLARRADHLAGTGGAGAEVIEAYAEAAAAAAGIGWSSGAVRGYLQGTRAALRARQAERAALLAETGASLAQPAELRDDEQRLRRMAAYANTLLRRFERALPHALTAYELAETTVRRRDALQLVLAAEIQTDRRRAAQRHLPILRALEVTLKNEAGVAAADLHMATTDAMMGRLTHALARLQAAFDFFEARGEPRELAGLYLNAAQIWLLLRDGPRARAHLAKVRAASERAGTSTAHLGAYEAAAYLLEERYAEAEAAQRATLKQLAGADAPMRISAHLGLAAALAHQGRHADAAAEVARARGLLTERSPRETRFNVLATECLVHLGAGDLDAAIKAGEGASVLRNPALAGAWDALVDTRLAEAWMRKGDARTALGYAQRAVGVALRLSSSLPDRVGAHHRAELETCFAWGIESAAAMKDVERLFTLAEQARAVGLRTRLGEGELAERATPPALREEMARREELESDAVRAYRMALQSAEPKPTLRALDALTRARADVQALREHVSAQRAIAGAMLHPRADTLAATRAGLADGEALVVYAAGATRVWALVVTREGARSVRLGTPRDVEALLEDSVVEDASADAGPEIARLAAAFSGPLALPKTVRRIRVVPTGTIARVPFAALWPDRALVLLPSATVGRLLAARAPARGGEVLAVGAGDTGLGPALPGAEAEARAVGSRVLVGEEATEAAAQALASREEPWRAVHVAAHGLIDTEHAVRSALLLHPSEKSDGLWSVSEILGATVRADLVSLSSCSSGRGQSFRQEGVFGFVHAFFVAGARRVLVSLWDVDDEATAALMTRFYGAWRPGTHPAAALRAAQAALRAETRWKHPAYWAAWQLWGAP